MFSSNAHIDSVVEINVSKVRSWMNVNIKIYLHNLDQNFTINKLIVARMLSGKELPDNKESNKVLGHIEKFFDVFIKKKGLKTN